MRFSKHDIRPPPLGGTPGEGPGALSAMKSFSPQPQRIRKAGSQQSRQSFEDVMTAKAGCGNA